MATTLTLGTAPARDRLFDWHRTAETAVYAFGHAGGSAGTLKALAAHVPEGIGFAEHVMPGRGHRHRESPDTSLPEVCRHAAAALAAAPGRPILLGYSLGALIAYETARQLQAAGCRPRALIACAMNAPHRLAPPAGVHRMPLPALRAYLQRLGGTPQEVLDDLHALAWFAPAIQADYRLVETYRHHDEPRLACPVIALAGRHDALTHGPDVAAWATLTSGSFHETWIDAPHFFMHAHAQAWARCFRQAASSAAAEDLPSPSRSATPAHHRP